MEIEPVGKVIVVSAIHVHKALGPGPFESAFQACLAYEWSKRCLPVACEVPLPVVYEGQRIKTGCGIDMLVENQFVVENKAFVV